MNLDSLKNYSVSSTFTDYHVEKDKILLTDNNNSLVIPFKWNNITYKITITEVRTLNETGVKEEFDKALLLFTRYYSDGVTELKFDEKTDQMLRTYSTPQNKPGKTNKPVKFDQSLISKEKTEGKPKDGDKISKINKRLERIEMTKKLWMQLGKPDFDKSNNEIKELQEQLKQLQAKKPDDDKDLKTLEDLHKNELEIKRKELEQKGKENSKEIDEIIKNQKKDIEDLKKEQTEKTAKKAKELKALQDKLDAKLEEQKQLDLQKEKDKPVSREIRITKG